MQFRTQRLWGARIHVLFMSARSLVSTPWAPQVELLIKWGVHMGPVGSSDPVVWSSSNSSYFARFTMAFLSPGVLIPRLARSTLPWHFVPRQRTKFPLWTMTVHMLDNCTCLGKFSVFSKETHFSWMSYKACL